MTGWEAAGVGLLIALLPCAVLCSRGETMARVAALDMAGKLTTLTLLVLAEALQRTILLDLALVAALLTLGGGMAFARFLERWL